MILFNNVFVIIVQRNLLKTERMCVWASDILFTLWKGPEVDTVVRIIYAQIAIFEQITTKKDNTISATDEYQLFVIGSQKSPEKKLQKLSMFIFRVTVNPVHLEYGRNQKSTQISSPAWTKSDRIN